MSIKLSIIIVAYKSQSVIEDCLVSIDKYNDLLEGELEVIVVDNSPSYELKSYLKTIRVNYFLHYYHNPSNGGFGQGNNIGCYKSSGGILFFLNPDTILVEPIFKFIVNEFQNHELTLAGFHLIDKEEKDNLSLGIMPEYSYFYLPQKLLNFLVIKLGLFSSFIFPWGASLVVRKRDFLKAGLFDENIFLCYEEPDLVNRIRPKKVKVFDKKIIHLEGHTTVLDEARLLSQLKSFKYYLEKNGKNYKFFLLVLLFRNKIKQILKKICLKSVEHDQCMYFLMMRVYKEL